MITDLEPVGKADIADEVLRPVAGVDKVLRVVVVRVQGLGPLEKGRRVAKLLRLGGSRRILGGRCGDFGSGGRRPPGGVSLGHEFNFLLVEASNAEELSEDSIRYIFKLLGNK